jgi:hypothetical protein
VHGAQCVSVASPLPRAAPGAQTAAGTWAPTADDAKFIEMMADMDDKWQQVGESMRADAACGHSAGRRKPQCAGRSRQTEPAARQEQLGRPFEAAGQSLEQFSSAG